LATEPAPGGDIRERRRLGQAERVQLDPDQRPIAVRAETADQKRPQAFSAIVGGGPGGRRSEFTILGLGLLNPLYGVPSVPVRRRNGPAQPLRDCILGSGAASSPTKNAPAVCKAILLQSGEHQKEIVDGSFCKTFGDFFRLDGNERSMGPFAAQVIKLLEIELAALATPQKVAVDVANWALLFLQVLQKLQDRRLGLFNELGLRPKYTLRRLLMKFQRWARHGVSSG
jgi:hypothetical protein